jgi:hypothetical protein
MVTKSRIFQRAGAFFAALAFMFLLFRQESLWWIPAVFLGMTLILMVISIITKYKELK